jgi:hypothetical protein
MTYDRFTIISGGMYVRGCMFIQGGCTSITTLKKEGHNQMDPIFFVITRPRTPPLLSLKRREINESQNYLLLERAHSYRKCHILC